MKEQKSSKFLKQLKYILPVLTTVILGGILVYLQFYSPKINTVSANDDVYQVVSVTDGDTINVRDANGKNFIVRYLYVDTPETVKPNTPVQCYGKEASTFNKQLLENKKVKLESDVEDKDVYKRLLRYVYVDENGDGKFSQDEMINNILLEKGYARIYIPPKGYEQKNVKYKTLFDETEASAKENKVGLWGACKDINTYVNPTITTTSQVLGVSDAADKSKGLTQETADCKIKGNINSKGDKIYHMPGQKFYNKTIITPETGERWFCTEQDAQNAGFKKSSI